MPRLSAIYPPLLFTILSAFRLRQQVYMCHIGDASICHKFRFLERFGTNTVETVRAESVKGNNTFLVTDPTDKSNRICHGLSCMEASSSQGCVQCMMKVESQYP